MGIYQSNADKFTWEEFDKEESAQRKTDQAADQPKKKRKLDHVVKDESNDSFEGQKKINKGKEKEIYIDLTLEEA
ncbi:hypothetical protein FRC02_002840 [Tulasnella sp. 418]|nr:hypothetical protein FRC02_002840 [Tulasnella sp. 418]